MSSYPALDPVPTGLRGRCPRCGAGHLYRGVLTVRESCEACELSFDFEDSGDGPTVFIIMILGFVVLGSALWVEFTFVPPPWVHFLLWPVVIVALGLPAIRAVKGALIALQYANDAASGRLDR